MSKVTCLAPVNIAVIKYWGKRDENLILPLNDSISTTLSLEDMCAKTTVMACPNFTENKFWLNGKEEDFYSVRLQNCLTELRKLCDDDKKEILDWKIHICSENNFPTAAGLASSAAGFACLVVSLANLYGVSGNISRIARLGSGSACRSIYGGWVQWHQGINDDGSDSVATQLHDENHWPEVKVLILVVNDAKKSYSSTNGMKQSVKTSTLLKHRVKDVLPDRIDGMIEAIKAKDFLKFATFTMKDSNQFHAICLDTYPPCVYMNDISHKIVTMVHEYNRIFQYEQIAYTFDAGPNACLYVLGEYLPKVLQLIKTVFPPKCDTVEYIRGRNVVQETSKDWEDTFEQFAKYEPGLLKYIIQTEIGEGPKVFGDDYKYHLLNEEGEPNL